LFLDKEDIDVNSKNNWGATPLILAAENEHLPVVRLLAGRDDVDQLWTDRFRLTGAYSSAWSRKNSAWSGSSTWSELSVQLSDHA
jgi:ankyrin repeat protein